MKLKSIREIENKNSVRKHELVRFCGDLQRRLLTGNPMHMIARSPLASRANSIKLKPIEQSRKHLHL